MLIKNNKKILISFLIHKIKTKKTVKKKDTLKHFKYRNLGINKTSKKKIKIQMKNHNIKTIYLI